MILTAFLLVCVYGMKLMPIRKFNNDYLSRDTTTAIKGIFVFLVFVCHFSQYYTFAAEPGQQFYWFRHNSGQLVVTMFLFYSGYGIFESIKKKGSGYVRQFPKNRILKTLIHLDVAVLIYLALNMILGISFKKSDILLSFIGWSSIGNSNWFMFAILAQYIIVFIAFMIFRKHKLPALITVSVLSVAYMFVMMKYKQSYWYNTALCLPLGMWYSYMKVGLEKAIMKNNFTYILFFAIFASMYFYSHKHSDDLIYYEIWMLSFTVLVVMLSMKVNICNKALMWLGNHVFSIYILQRIPMIILTKNHIHIGSVSFTFVACFAATAVLAEVFDLITGAADKKLFAPKAEKKKEETVTA